MKVELKDHIGVLPSGRTVKQAQWMVYAEDVLVGYLSHDESLPIMFLCNQTDEITKEIVDKCSAITGRAVKPPMPIVLPPQIDNSKGEDEDEDDDQ